MCIHVPVAASFHPPSKEEMAGGREKTTTILLASRPVRTNNRPVTCRLLARVRLLTYLRSCERSTAVMLSYTWALHLLRMLHSCWCASRTNLPSVRPSVDMRTTMDTFRVTLKLWWYHNRMLRTDCVPLLGEMVDLSVYFCYEWFISSCGTHTSTQWVDYLIREWNCSHKSGRNFPY